MSQLTNNIKNWKTFLYVLPVLACLLFVGGPIGFSSSPNGGGIGACCYQADNEYEVVYDCDQYTESECIKLGGDFFGVGSDCSDTDECGDGDTEICPIVQYEDCDENGDLFLTAACAEPYAYLSGLYLGCADLADANLNGADLLGADLTDAILAGANLAGADLTDAILTSADLTDADLQVADLTYADLTDADLDFADLSSANLTGANLTSADLTDAILAGANLNGADLNSANLQVANLQAADLTNADLTNADLTNADLTGANLDFATGWEFATWLGAAYNDATIFPEGMEPEKFGMFDVSPCIADLDFDGEVKVSDLLILLADWGQCPVQDWCIADLDGDIEVKVADLLILIARWGPCY